MNWLFSGFNGILTALIVLGGLQFLYFIFSGGIPGTRFYYARRLRDGSAMVRQETIKELFAKGAEFARELLLQALDGSDASTRALAIEALGHMGDAEVAPRLIKHLKDPSLAIQMKTIEALTNYPSLAASEAIAEITPKADPRVQIVALRYFRDHPDVARVPLAAQLVLSFDEHVPRLAMALLSEFPDEALAEIAKLIPSADDRTSTAIAAMLEIDRSASAEHLMSILSEVRYHGALRDVIETLGRLGAPGTADFLAPYASDAGFPMRDVVLDALGNLPEPSAIKHLLRLQAEPDPRLRTRAKRALSKAISCCSVEQILPIMGAALRAPEVAIARSAAIILGEYAGLKGVAVVMRVLWGEDAPEIQGFLEGMTGTPLGRLVTFDEMLLAIDRLTSDTHPSTSVQKTLNAISSLLIVLHGDKLRGLRVDPETTDLMVRGRRVLYPLHYEHLHPMAKNMLEWVASKAEGDRWRTQATV